jgi:enoyl-CoA hydratase/carnithine racemase
LIAYLTLNRPDRANTINAQLADEVNRALDEVAADRELRVVILTGAGKHFCGGADLRGMGAGSGLRRTTVDFISHIEQVPVPVIAAINGAAMGGGCEIALACDLRVMSESAQIGTPEIRFGALPAGGGTQRLPRLIGPARAKQLIFSGLPIGANEALQIGLVNRVTSPEALLPACEEIAHVLAERAAYALAAAKFLINQALQTDLESGLKLERMIIARMASPKQREEAVKQAMSSQATYANIFRARGEEHDEGPEKGT